MSSDTIWFRDAAVYAPLLPNIACRNKRVATFDVTDDDDRTIRIFVAKMKTILKDAHRFKPICRRVQFTGFTRSGRKYLAVSTLVGAEEFDFVSRNFINIVLTPIFEQWRTFDTTRTFVEIPNEQPVLLRG